ncbi:conserved hypothetical protein [Altererythrobacter sp. B11]|uniref:DUF3237 domain-containing protein n=1 Tax=Altererythrobacter sp. B11 TaxID=2060312 RepID=UPI000DC735D0|nr:DUF3237 domain-containing protein [Altererythrobacter sp. B11]BBC72440.1 conserved hypothetical protein [Altererythrobacter sp. B11]
MKARTMAVASALGAALVAGGAAAQAPQEPKLEFAFEETVLLGQAVAPGDTARGGRLIIPITGGTFEGPEIRGEVVPGGWDWQLRRADGCTDVKADYFLKTDDGVVINVVNTGVICPPAAGQAPPPVRTHPVFEPPLGKYEWLGKSAFIGTLEMAPDSKVSAVRIRFYRLR